MFRDIWSISAKKRLDIYAAVAQAVSLGASHYRGQVTAAGKANQLAATALMLNLKDALNPSTESELCEIMRIAFLTGCLEVAVKLYASMALIRYQDRLIFKCPQD